MAEFSKIMQAAYAVCQGKITIEEAAKEYDVNLTELQKECKNLPNYLSGGSEPEVTDPPQPTVIDPSKFQKKLSDFSENIKEKLLPKKGDIFTTNQKLNKEDFEKINKEISGYGEPIEGGYIGQYHEYKGAWSGRYQTQRYTKKNGCEIVTFESSVEPEPNSDRMIWKVVRTVVGTPEHPSPRRTTTTINYFNMYTGELEATAHDNGAGKIDYINYETGNVQSIQGV